MDVDLDAKYVQSIPFLLKARLVVAPLHGIQEIAEFKEPVFIAIEGGGHADSFNLLFFKALQCFSLFLNIFTDECMQVATFSVLLPLGFGVGQRFSQQGHLVFAAAALKKIRERAFEQLLDLLLYLFLALE